MTKNRKRNRVKKRVIRDGFLRAPIYPTISHSALSELFEFVGFKGCSVNPREPGWWSVFHKPDLSYVAECLSGVLFQAHFTSERGRKQQESWLEQPWGPGRAMPRTLASPSACWHREGQAPGRQMCAHTCVCHCWSVWGSRHRLGFWSRKGDRFITKYRIRSSRAGAWVDKGSLFPALLSSYLLGPLRYLVTTAFVTVSGFYLHSVSIICLDAAFLRVWSLLKHRRFFQGDGRRKEIVCTMQQMMILLSFSLNLMPLVNSNLFCVQTAV